jgi:hypothetical protein
MQKTFQGLGWLFFSIGAALIVANFVMSFMGLGASYNFGDPAKFQFILVPFWQIGLVIAAIGGACLLVSRRLNRTLH